MYCSRHFNVQRVRKSGNPKFKLAWTIQDKQIPKSKLSARRHHRAGGDYASGPLGGRNLGQFAAGRIGHQPHHPF